MMMMMNTVGGEGRTGVVLSLYLMHQYQLTSNQAAEEIIKQAVECQVSRKPKVNKIEQFIATKTLGKT